MTVQKIVGLCKDLLQYDFDQELFLEGVNIDYVKQSQKSNKNFGLLVKCVALCEMELACDYFPLKAKQEFLTNSVKLSEFNRPLHEVVKVYNPFGEEVKFVSNVDGIVADTTGGIVVHYHYRPTTKEYFDELERGNPKMDERLFAYGAIAEFMFLSGMYDDATIWDKRYKDLIQVTLYSNKSLKIPERRWA